MEQIIIQIAKYIIILAMAVYTFQCFSVFKFTREHDRKGIYLRQIFLMVIIHFFGSLSLYCSFGELKYFRAYLIQQIGIILIIVVYRAIYPTANRLIINNMCMLLTIGFMTLSRLSYNRAMKQFYIVIGSFIVTLIVPFLISRVKFFPKFKWAYVGVGIGSLLFVLLFSSTTYGSKLNVSIANYTFQPSEYVKIIFVFAISSILAYSKSLKDVIISGAVALAHILLLVASKDLGSALIIFVVYLCMLLVATRNYLYFFLGLFAMGAGSVVGYKLFSHVRVRVLAFREPLGNIADAGYQISQSLFAIGTGGFLGMGLGQGAPDTIPVVAADFIFSAICEEFGVFFGICLILVCTSCFIMFMNIAMKFKDKFYKLVALGLGVAYAFQVFLTIGGVIKFIPLTGVTLPLVSYGGTSVAVTCCVFAIIQGLYIYKNHGEEKLPDNIIRKVINKQGIQKADKQEKLRRSRSIKRDNPPEVIDRSKSKDEAWYGENELDTQLMDEAFRKAVEEGINFSEEPDLDEFNIDDIDD